MKRSISSLFAVCIAAASTAHAQAPAGPPKVLMIYREEVKPARGNQHTAVEAGFAQVWSKAGAQPYLAMTAVTGSATDALFISAYPSWEAVDKDMAAFDKGSSTLEFAALSKQEADLITNAKQTLASYREDLSYNADKISAMVPHSRYAWIRTTRVKPGHGPDFVEMQKALIKAHSDAKMDESWATFQVVGGAQSGTFITFQFSKTFAEVEANNAAHKAMRDAAGAEFAAKMKKHSEDDIAYDQSDIFAFSPKMSYPSKEFVAADAAFWTPKAAAAPAKPVATKKEAKKP